MFIIFEGMEGGFLRISEIKGKCMERGFLRILKIKGKCMERGFSRIWRIFADSFLRELTAMECKFYPCKLKVAEHGFDGFSRIGRIRS
ncbi:MAG: hypothetical protein FWG87_04430 [Defluviitaleaceae bacterium]|nr:hypothetical protein [Defluviitaleaceae bacterium]